MVRRLRYHKGKGESGGMQIVCIIYNPQWQNIPTCGVFKFCDLCCFPPKKRSFVEDFIILNVFAITSFVGSMPSRDFFCHHSTYAVLFTNIRTATHFSSRDFSGQQYRAEKSPDPVGSFEPGSPRTRWCFLLDNGDACIEMLFNIFK